MKTRFNYLALALLLTIAAPSVKAASGTGIATENPSMMTDAQKLQRIEEIKARAEAIKEMDKTLLSKQDRAELKQELKSMKQEIGVYRRVHILVKLIVLVVLIIILIILV